MLADTNERKFSPSMKRAIFLLLPLILSACVKGPSQKYELSAALPPKLGHWCALPNEDELAYFETAVRAIELSKAVYHGGSLATGAMQTFGYGVNRRDPGYMVSLCVPDEIMAKFESALNARGGLGPGRAVDYQIMAAARFKRPSEKIIEQVAEVAFNDNIQDGTLIRTQEDIRPIALTVLAGFGELAAPYGDLAFSKMDRKDSLGVGAAHVAIATGRPGALAKVVEMFQSELDDVPPEKLIPYKTSKRLQELAWAIHLAGPAGKSHANLIHNVMRRKVESPAPPFGMVAGAPIAFCSVLRRIEGEDATRQYDYCGAGKDPFRLPEQMNVRESFGWGE